MVRTPKKLFQGQAAYTNAYTVPVSTITQIVEIWIANTSYYSRTVEINAHGIETANTLIAELILPPQETKIISNCKIVLTEGETFGAKQSGSGVIMTVYGIEQT